MLNLSVKTTHNFKGDQPNVFTVLFFTGQDTEQRLGKFISAHSPSVNTGKAKWPFSIFYPCSPRGYILGHIKLFHCTLQSHFPFCPFPSISLHTIRKPKMFSVRSCSCTTFFIRLLTSLRTSPTKFSHFI